MKIDVFNGDADGLCALVQLRQAQPLNATLVTGVKRDIGLLARVQAQADDFVTVLDISLKQNQADLQRILAAGARVFYVDHHQTGDMPTHPNLTALIDTDAQVCTSLLVNRHLHGRFKAWAITAAFGDNLAKVATQLAADAGLSERQTAQLENLGHYLNYNSYGHSVADLSISPVDLYEKLRHYALPFDFIADNTDCYAQLETAYHDDMRCAEQTGYEYADAQVAVLILPNTAWARRVSGVFANELANRYPHRAHAILTDNLAGGYLVSVRSPLSKKNGADTLCASFATGGGRKGAAGINHLPFEQLSEFIQRLITTYSA